VTDRPFQGVDADDLASCVACGLCLPHCPTYRTTGSDSQSPRGRIALIAGVRDGALDLDGGITEAIDSCVQCMGCMPACPSGVRYDRIIAPVVEEMTTHRRGSRRRRSLVLSPLGRPRLLRLVTFIALLAARLGVLPKRFGAPPLSFGRAHARCAPASSGERIVIFSGCVMDAWYGHVHRDTHAVLTAMGFSASFSEPALCCGALHSHGGLSARAKNLEERVTAELSGATLVVNSAGCGAHLRALFSKDPQRPTRVVEVMDFIDLNMDRLLAVCPPAREGLRESVVVHDACHLRNLLGTHLAAHRVLGVHHRVLPVPDDGLCCGAGGAFALEHPVMAREIAERKYVAIDTVVDAGVKFISSGNPGCIGHLAANKPSTMSHVSVVHPVQLVARMIASKQESEGAGVGDQRRF